MARSLFIFLKSIYSNRRIIARLTLDDLKQKYVGSYLGIFWAFIQPTVTILVLWFVFSVGFKAQPVQDYPFVLWLMAGMIPWFFIAEALGNGSNAIISKPYLVQKIKFQVNLLPLIQICSSLIIHLFFVVVLVAMFLLYGYNFDLYWLQIPYSMFCAIYLLIGLSWFTSAIILFFRDLGQVIAVVIQFGFWLTPIFWSANMVPERYHSFLKLNPAYYITEGYRNAVINQVWFWENYIWGIYFWGVSTLIFLTGALVFRKLRPHFADVL